MESSLLSKTSCSHRFVDQCTRKCLHCGCPTNSVDLSVVDSYALDYVDDDGSLEREHYERLELMLDTWKKSMIENIESIHKAKLQRIRDEFERQQAQRRRLTSERIKEQGDENDEHEQNGADISSAELRLVHFSSIDTEYTLMAASSDTFLVHDGRSFKLFDHNIRPLAALDLTSSMRERSKVVDLCYVPVLSVYLILFEQCLWSFQPGGKANLITPIRRRGYISLTTNTKDVFILDEEGTLEQRSLISWAFLRKYSKQHLLPDSTCDNLISVRFHSTQQANLAAIVRTSNNRRCLIIYTHLGSNTFRIQQRILFPNSNIYTVSSIHMSHVWIVTTCEKQCFFFADNKREYHQREEQQTWPKVDCDYRIKNALQLASNSRTIVLRTVRPSQIRLYHF